MSFTLYDLSREDRAYYMHIINNNYYKFDGFHYIYNINGVLCMSHELRQALILLP